MLHKEVLNISFLHRHKIKTVFSEILGIEGIEHFSLDLVNPSGEMLFLSGTPQHAFEICNKGLSQYDGIISPEYYQNNEFYWWNDAAHKAYAKRIRQIREYYLGLINGFMLVRKWNDFYLIYSFAAKKNTIDFQTKIINKLNLLLQMGDHCYSKVKDIYEIYCGEYDPPIIDKFYSFQGGKPKARFSEHYNQNLISSENNNVIQLFAKKVKIE